jgi:diguanylate cyclase
MFLRISPRFNFSLKLGLWLALFGILSSALTGYYAYSASRALLTRSAETKLLTSSQVLARRVTYSLDQIVHDVRFIEALPTLRRFADRRLAPAERSVQQRKLEEIFISLMVAHAEYFQIRVIGADDHGRELVRVDRDNIGIRPVRGADLQEKGHFPYVFEALRLPPGTLYFSHINLNRELGAHQGLNKPTLRIAMPIQGGDGASFGIIVINVDLDGMFGRLRADLPDEIKVLLTNDEGDYLIHPDPAKTFGFDHGRRIRIQDEVPATASILDRNRNNLVLTLADADTDGKAVGAFVRVPFDPRSERRFLMVGLTTPLDKVRFDSRSLGFNIIRIALIFSLLALAVSFVLSRVLTQPLDAIARAIGQFETGRPITGLPVERNDEIGYLAKSFLSMTSRLNSQVDQLKNRELHLDYLAHHDQLTGLPNRILFLDRLVQAIHKASRNGRQFAVMFIDLDKFKEINDSLGHHVGDTVLKQAALRMQSAIRDEDTISRLGGDEFTMIVEELDHPQQCLHIAEKLVALFQQPFAVDDSMVELTCSIGISVFPADGEQAEVLLHCADAAMYQAKKKGRNNYQLYETPSAA